MDNQVDTESEVSADSAGSLHLLIDIVCVKQDVVCVQKKEKKVLGCIPRRSRGFCA